MHDTKERLSFGSSRSLNYRMRVFPVRFRWLANSAPHFPCGSAGFSGLVEIPIAMIPACRLLPFRGTGWRISSRVILTLVNGFLTFVLPLTNGNFRDPVFPAYVFFATIETVCTSVIIWQAWTWSGVETVRTS